MDEIIMYIVEAHNEILLIIEMINWCTLLCKNSNLSYLISPLYWLLSSCGFLV